MEVVPNLRGGPPAWVAFLIGPLLGAIVVGIGLVVAIARMPDGTKFDAVRDDVAAIKQKIAVMEARQSGKADLDDLRNKTTDAKLDALLRKGKQ